MNDRPAPLAPPSGSSVSTALGSVVSLPSLSSPQPTGIFSPRSAAPMILPLATTPVEKSRRYGRPLRRGTANAIGLEDTAGTRSRSRCRAGADRKSTRVNSSHVSISYAVFCLKKKTLDARGADEEAEKTIRRELERASADAIIILSDASDGRSQVRRSAENGIEFVQWYEYVRE